MDCTQFTWSRYGKDMTISYVKDGVLARYRGTDAPIAAGKTAGAAADSLVRRVMTEPVK